MIPEIIILIAAALLAILGVCLLQGKGSGLIAGWNAMSEEEKRAYDERAVCRSSAVVCFIVAGMLCVMAWLGYRVDRGEMSEELMVPFAVIFVVVVLGSIVAGNAYVRKKGKKRAP